jgi:hypothetical protein
MKKGLLILFVLAGFTAFSQSNAKPVLAKGTVAKKKSQPIVGANKPVMAATAKVPTAANTAINADRPKSVMGVGSKELAKPADR